MAKENTVSALIQDELRKRNLPQVAAVDAARWLHDAGVLKDSTTRPGKPLRDLLRSKRIIGQRQELNSRWFIDRIEPSAGTVEAANVVGMAKVRTVRVAKSAGNAGSPAAGVDQDAQKRFATAREKYRPGTVRYLLVAESPPTAVSGRFFYFENVTKKDSLFWETMKVLYPSDMPSSGYPRHRKREFLRRFKADGFFLLDAVDDPLGKVSSPFKRRRIRESLPRLRDDLRRVCGGATKIILISAPVYAVCDAALKAEGFNVVNDKMIDFPGSGCQDKFRAKLRRAIRSSE